jgi:hypothetical protein
MDNFTFTFTTTTTTTAAAAVGLQLLAWYIREFALFSVYSSKNCPSAKCASAANVV